MVVKFVQGRPFADRYRRTQAAGVGFCIVSRPSSNVDGRAAARLVSRASRDLPTPERDGWLFPLKHHLKDNSRTPAVL